MDKLHKTTSQDVIRQEIVVSNVQAAYDAVVEANAAYRQNNHVKELPRHLHNAQYELYLQLIGENAKLIGLRHQKEKNDALQEEKKGKI